MGDKRLTELLRWGIQNSPAPSADNNDNTNNNDAAAAPPASNLTPEILAALMGGPSDADLMKASLEIAGDPDVTLENKLIALDNFEQLIENLDNANNIANLGLWAPLLALLAHPEPDVRRMAAWCVGTAVQNNERTQERLLAVGGVPPLVALALADAEPVEVRRKAVYALSSAVRNYQPAMDACAGELRKGGFEVAEGVDAGDMEKVDVVITGLRERVKASAAAAAA